jgi:hypothetical protein
MIAFLSGVDVAKTVGALAAVVVVVGGLVALLRWLRNRPGSSFHRRGPLPLTVDELAQIQRDAADAFYNQLMEISSAVEQFEPSLKGRLTRPGRGRSRPLIAKAPESFRSSVWLVTL